MVKIASFLFIGDLNDFLPRRQQGKSITCPFNKNQSVKHLIESLGVPHVEVYRITVNGEEGDFEYLVQEGDGVVVHPFSNDVIQTLQAEKHRFLLDNHLGRLAVYLRMLGFDAQYRNDFQDEELAQISSEEGRTLLTREVRLLMRNLPAIAVATTDLSDYEAMLSGIMGYKINQKDFYKIGERIFNLERLMNMREGIRRADDTLPNRLLKEVREDGRPPIELEKMLKQYYQLRGWNACGEPMPSVMGRLEIAMEPALQENLTY